MVDEGAVRRPSVARLLSGLTLPVHAGDATTTSRANIDALLARVAAWRSTGFPSSAREDATRKPDPQVYKFMLEQLGSPGECPAIEIQRACRRQLGGPAPSRQRLHARPGFSGALTVLSDLGECDAPARVLSGAHRPHRSGRCCATECLAHR
jgi:hypothetical protein